MRNMILSSLCSKSSLSITTFAFVTAIFSLTFWCLAPQNSLSRLCDELSKYASFQNSRSLVKSENKFEINFDDHDVVKDIDDSDNEYYEGDGCKNEDIYCDVDLPKSDIKHEEKTTSTANGDITSVRNRKSNININTNKQKFPCTTYNLSQFLHNQPIIGMHVICFGEDGTYFTVYKFASNDKFHRLSMNISLRVSYDFFRNTIVDQLHLEEDTGRPKQPWMIFNTKGEQIVISDSKKHSGPFVIQDIFVREGMLLLMEGGTWMWPGVYVGFHRTVELSSIIPRGRKISVVNSMEPPRNVTIETLSLKPLVLSVKNFISKPECDYIREKAKPTLKYSDVTLMDNDKGRKSTDWRTSQSTFVLSANDVRLKDLDQRIASLTRVPYTHQENLQVLRYGNAEKYSSHYDFFHPDHYKDDAGTMKLIENGKKNRFATVLWYLSDVEQGGHTIFPRASETLVPRNVNDCTRGLKVKPETGKVIIFYNLLANGIEDNYSMHGACPVIKGIKWAANKWVWNAPMLYMD